jgi:hypothetical protein
MVRPLLVLIVVVRVRLSVVNVVDRERLSVVNVVMED